MLLFVACCCSSNIEKSQNFCENARCIEILVLLKLGWIKLMDC